MNQVEDHLTSLEMVEKKHAVVIDAGEKKKTLHKSLIFKCNEDKTISSLFCVDLTFLKYL